LALYFLKIALFSANQNEEIFPCILLEPKVVTISARQHAIMKKIANFVRLYFSRITTFFNRILEFYYF
jgi:hypothetical protein